MQFSEADLIESAVTVIFDDSVISIDELKKLFGKEGFPVVGEPVILQ